MIPMRNGISVLWEVVRNLISMLTKRNLRETQYYSHINAKTNQQKLINIHSNQEFLNREVAYDLFTNFSYTVVIQEANFENQSMLC